MKTLKKILKGMGAGAVAAVLLLILTIFVPSIKHFTDKYENQSYYLRYQWKSNTQATGRETNVIDTATKKIEAAPSDLYSDIVIVDIDNRSQEKMGNYWSWNRSYHGTLLKSLGKHYPAAVGFDILFATPEDSMRQQEVISLLKETAQQDSTFVVNPQIVEKVKKRFNYNQQFIDAVKSTPHIYGSLILETADVYKGKNVKKNQYKATLDYHNRLNPESAITIPSEYKKFLPSNRPYIEGIYPELAQSLHKIGLVNIQPNSDGIIREIPILFNLGKHDPVYLPLSIRMVASLFGTKNEDIKFVPGEYLDIGTPFKAFKDSTGELRFSYPNVSAPQIRKIIEHSAEIKSLAVGKSLDISSFVSIKKDRPLAVTLKTPAGEFPFVVSQEIRKIGLDKILSLKEQESIEGDITIVRDSDIEWIVTLPSSEEEFYLLKNDFETLLQITSDMINLVRSGEEMLVYQNFTVRNVDGELRSSIPVLKGAVLEELCTLSFSTLQQLKVGEVKHFGEPVRIPLTHDNKHIVTYFGKQNKQYRYRSYYDIMKDRIQEDFEGKIFIIGSSTTALFDIVSTPVSETFPGVEVHASLVNSMLSNTFVTKSSQGTMLFVIILISLLFGVLVYTIKPLFSSIIAFVFAFVYIQITVYYFNNDLLWMELVRPTVAIFFSYTIAMVFKYISEERDKKYLHQTFKFYLSPKLIDTMYETRQLPALGGEENECSAYFTDIQGFSTFSEELQSPAKLVELLNEYLTEMTDILLDHDGTLDKFEGDAIIAFFGAPLKLENHALSACFTALKMQDKLSQLRDKWRSEGDKWPVIVHNMRMRIGINSGPMITGNMGSMGRLSYTMMGDAVNLAARLESAAKQFGVYTMISHYTYEQVKDFVVARSLGRIMVVGKSEAITVYELLGEKGHVEDDIEKLISLFHKGLELFYTKEWDEAVELFSQCENLEIYKENSLTPSRKMLHYCKNFKKNPPPQEWNGVITLDSK